MGKKKYVEYELLRPFIVRVKKRFAPVKVILFGSRARGVVHQHSDYDILVVSPKFKRIEFSERCALLYSMKRDIRVPMDIICLTPEEYDERSRRPTIFREIAREGKDITALA